MNKKQLRRQAGAAMVEYAMLLAVLALSVNLTVGANGIGVKDTLMEVSAALGGGTQRDNFVPESTCEPEGELEIC